MQFRDDLKRNTYNAVAYDTENLCFGVRVDSNHAAGISTTGSMAGTLGARNPLRYRGYVYDQETGLYYLQSRYYDPKVGRFINADAFTSTGQGLLGNNMFAYCLNNSVNYVDPSGQIVVIDDLLVLSSVVVISIPVIALIIAPPPPVMNELTDGFSQIYVLVTEVIEHTADILTAKAKGKERVKDTGLAHESDEEVQRKAHDKSLPKSERRRYQTEEKARGIRNRRKRIDLYQ